MTILLSSHIGGTLYLLKNLIWSGSEIDTVTGGGVINDVVATIVTGAVRFLQAGTLDLLSALIMMVMFDLHSTNDYWKVD